MIKKVLSIKDPRLRQKSKPIEKIDKSVKNLVQDLMDTLDAQKDPEGVGLAGPQIGVFRRVFVMRHKGKITPIINPEITKISKINNDPPKGKEHEYIMEGCLSLPHYYGPVRRARSIEVKYLTPKGEKRVEKFSGFSAQIIQHEVDHLNGKIFVDRLIEQRRQLFQLQKNHWHEVELP